MQPCGELKDVDQFQIMNPRTRKRRPGCKACNAIWRKDRYLSSQKLERLGPVLRFILEHGDAHLASSALTVTNRAGRATK